jgi:hypothetical protein
VILAQAPATPVAAARPRTEAEQIIRIAKRQIGDPWRHGATGPRAFDCSGLVIYAFRHAGDAKAIGRGHHRSARALYRWFEHRGLASRSHPHKGDLVIWGGGTHVGIYLGHGRAISTLTNGVRVHRVHAVTARFTAFLHTGMWKKSTKGGNAAQSAATKASSSSHHVRQTRGRVNLRRGAGVGHTRIGTLRDHTRLVVVGRGRDQRGRVWLKVRVHGHTGWVARWLTR